MAFRGAGLSPAARRGREVKGDGHAIGYRIVNRLLTASGVSVRRGVEARYLIETQDGRVAGIATDQKICFKYFEFTADKKREYRHDGKLYSVSPYALTWDNENYYLIAFDTEAGFIKHYRVDRMTDISLTDESRDGADVFRQHDMGVYTRQAFSMFGGASETVEIEFDNHLAGVVLDRFGKDVVMLKTDEQHFKIRAEVMVSPQFFAWVFGLETGARIVGPDSVVAGMLEQLDAVRKTYESN